MRHRRQIDHHCSGPEIVDAGCHGVVARVQHRVLELGDRTLPIGLTERNQPDTRGDQTADESMQERTQCHFNGNALRRQADCDDNGNHWLDTPKPEPFPKRVDRSIGPNLAERREIRGTLLRGFQGEFRCSAERRGEFRDLDESRVTVVHGTVPRLHKENRVVACSSIAEIGVQPVDQAQAIVDLCRFDRRFESVRVTVRPTWEGR
jgi:hypothetical protein